MKETYYIARGRCNIAHHVRCNKEIFAALKRAFYNIILSLSLYYDVVVAHSI